MAQMVKHVIATPVDHAGLDYGVIESGIADQFFRRPL